VPPLGTMPMTMPLDTTSCKRCRCRWTRRAVREQVPPPPPPPQRKFPEPCDSRTKKNNSYRISAQKSKGKIFSNLNLCHGWEFTRPLVKLLLPTHIIVAIMAKDFMVPFWCGQRTCVCCMFIFQLKISASGIYICMNVFLQMKMYVL